MKHLRILLVGALAVAVLASATAALAADEPILKIGGTTYTKWLWGNQSYDGSVYNFTTVPGEGFGDNGQGSEIELLLSARLSRQVMVNGRIHSRFNQNQWTNFGGFGGSSTANCIGGDCGEFDPRSNQYVKLRGVTVTLTPGYSWINNATIGASDFGMFDPFTIGKIRYIDRDNASGLLFQGSLLERKLAYDVTRISLPRLWAGPNYSTGDYTGADACYGVQLKATPDPRVDIGGIMEYVSDLEIQSLDRILDDGQKTRQRVKNSVAGVKAAIRPDPKVDLSVAAYSSYIAQAPDLTPTSFGVNGYSSVIAGRRHFDAAYKANLALNDPFNVGLSFQVEGFDIGAKYTSIMAARRETDVLLTEGWDGTFSFPGPANAAYGTFSGNPSRIGYGGWDGNMHQVATLNVDNEFTDFDEQAAETAIGWKGVTVAPQLSKGGWDFSGELTMIDYSTNWQAWGDPTRAINSTIYPATELDAGVGHNFRSAYAPFQDRQTMIGVFNAKTVIEAGKGVDLFGKFKYIKDEDNRMTDPNFLPYDAGDCPGGGPCAGSTHEYNGVNSTADIYGNPAYITVTYPDASTASGYRWKPFDSVTDDDRDLKYWMVSVGAGYQCSNDFYGSAAIEHYNADLLDGNTAFQAYQLHELVSGKHVKNKLRLKGRYILGGVEIGSEYQYNFGTFEPDFGTGFVPQVANNAISLANHVPVNSLGFEGRFGGWNSLEKREFKHHQLKAFMKVQF